MLKIVLNHISKNLPVVGLIVLTVSGIANAEVTGADAREIYDALNIPEVRVSIGRMGINVFSKSVGGLDCTRTRVVYPVAESKYSCELKAEKNDREIYENLGVEEIPISADSDLESFELKTVGGLDCEKKQAKTPLATIHFNCSL